MKKFSKIIALAMAAVMTFSSSPALIAQAKETDLGAQTLYYSSKDCNGSVSFSIDDITKVDSVKSSKISIVRPSSYNIYKNQDTSYYYNESKNAFEKSEYDNNHKYASFSFRGVKAGTSKITIKSGKNTYVKTLTFKNYTNPLKSLTISNVNNGKNISNKFKKMLILM